MVSRPRYQVTNESFDLLQYAVTDNNIDPNLLSRDPNICYTHTLPDAKAIASALNAQDTERDCKTS